MNKDKTIIKTSVRYWIETIGGTFAILIVFPIYAIFHWGAEFYFVGGLGLLFGIISLSKELKSAFTSNISFTDSEIKGRIGSFNFSELRENIKVVQFSGRGEVSRLAIWTEKHTIHIPCKYFDEKELNKLLREYLPIEVFDPLAFQKLPQFQEWQDERMKLFSNLHEPLKVSLGKSEKIIGSISLFFCLIMVGLLYFNKDNIILLILIVFFGGLGLFLILWSIGKIEGTSETITLNTFFGNYVLAWRDLREIYVNSNKQVFALIGEKSRIILPSPLGWSGKDKQQLVELINYKLETSGVQVINSKKYLYSHSKNFET